MTNDKAHIGIIGLGVMGRSLALNIERNSYGVAVFDREQQVLDRFASETQGKRILSAASPEELARALERPRKIVLLVKAGDPVDWTINLFKPFLEPGDILIDGGNSHFKDTERREKQLKSEGLYLIGSGTSGGEEGALWGPCLMPGGDRDAYESIRGVWEAIAAKVPDGPCVSYIGPGGSGHFVKMVHNGIEYADMQLIAEAYDLLRTGFGQSAEEIAGVFEEWNRWELESYLVEIAARILRVKDPETGKPLVDLVLDQAGQKGTGRWASEIAMDLGVPVPTIDAAVVARNISARKQERVEANKRVSVRTAENTDAINHQSVEAIRDALYASRICAYTQGMNLIKAASDSFGWGIKLSEVARIWQGGCIIRARLLKKVKAAYEQQPELGNLLLDRQLDTEIERAQLNWRKTISTAQQQGIPVLAMSSSLGYFDMYRAANLPLNLTQAQRDFFGAHTYERVDRPELGFVHSDWE